MKVGVALLLLVGIVAAAENKQDDNVAEYGFSQARLPSTQIDPAKIRRELTPRPDELKRYRRGFRSYFYNYLDEIAMSICASIPSEGPGLLYAVRRTCGEKATCKDICTDPKLRKQGPKEVQSLQWGCSESLHVYKRQPSLADNYEDYTDSHKLGLAIYRHYSCTIGGCGPNYCCCRAA